MTTIADKLGVDFALVDRRRARKSSNAARNLTGEIIDKMEILVGDVRDKVSFYYVYV